MLSLHRLIHMRYRGRFHSMLTHRRYRERFHRKLSLHSNKLSNRLSLIDSVHGGGESPWYRTYSKFLVRNLLDSP